MNRQVVKVLLGISVMAVSGICTAFSVAPTMSEADGGTAEPTKEPVPSVAKAADICICPGDVITEPPIIVTAEPTPTEAVPTDADDVVDVVEEEQKEEQTNRSGVYPTDYEYQILYKVTEAEASGCTIEQKMNVVSCVLARVINPTLWPNTIHDVVFQERQFSVVANGMYDRAVPDEDTIKAVNDVVQTVGLTHDCEFFCSYGCKSSWFASKGEPVFRDGVHRYYY